MDDIEKSVILEMAKCDMNCNLAAEQMYRSRSGVQYYIKKIKSETGLDCRRFYDLIELLKMIDGG